MTARRECIEVTPVVRFPWRAVAPLSLLAFTLAFYREIGSEGRILLSFDPLGYFIPHLTYLGQAARELRLPLWDLYLFGGVPFLANSQTGVLYPPNWIAALLPAPRAYAWLIVGHAALAAVGAYLFARVALRVGYLGSIAAALVFAFGGWPVGQTGHLNQFEAVAWLPWALLVVDRLLRAPSLRRAVLGGLLLALQFLAGHTQTVYLSAWVLALYVAWVALGRLLEARRFAESRRELPTWLLSRAVALGVVGVVTVGLSAPQLLPTLELQDLSIRAAGLDYNMAASFSLRPFLVLQGLLPTFGEPAINAEWLGYVGVAGLLLVGVALALRPDRRVVGMLLVALLGLALAFGQFSPIYTLAYHHVPGVGLFRVPARWLFVYTAAMAGLVGVGLDALAGASAGQVYRRGRLTITTRALAVLLGLLAGLVALLALYELVAPSAYPLVIPGAATLGIWAVSAALGIGLVVASLGHYGAVSRVAPGLLLALLAAELLGASLSLGVNQTGPDQAATGLTPEVELLRSAASAAPEAPFRVLGVGSRDYRLADQARTATALSAEMTPDEVAAYLASIRDRQMETPNVPLTFGLATIDGYDGGVLPLQRYLGLKSLFPEEGNDVVDGRLYVQVQTAPDPRLIAWLNVRYLIMNRTGDLTVDGVYYDMAMPQQVTPGGSIQLNISPPMDVSAIGLVSYLAPGTEPTGTQVGDITVATLDGSILRLPLRAGVETGAGKPAADQTVPPSVGRAPGDPESRVYEARLVLPSGTRVTRLTIENTRQQSLLSASALTLIGPDGSTRIVDLSPDYRLAYLGDTKVYDNLAVLPRAYVVGQVRAVASDRAALDALGSSDFDPSREAVVTSSALHAAGIQPEGGSPAPVRILEYSAERVLVDASLAAPGLLVLADTNYPGWRAMVDGTDRPIVTADYIFKGVWLDQGNHRVEFRFEPASVERGLRVGEVVALLSLVLVVFGPRLERRLRLRA